ncbi:hypothetical protein DL768_010428 [Monosporascus sp. mg162]|nr:hypothetical protein DL768_010428 [Monosporascus sp. mg162]
MVLNDFPEITPFTEEDFKDWKTSGIRIEGPASWQMAYQAAIFYLIPFWEREWASCLDELDNIVRVKMEDIMDPNTKDRMMFDASFIRSRFYFEVIQMLRIFSDMIRETGRDLQTMVSDPNMASHLSWKDARDEALCENSKRILRTNWDVVKARQKDAEKRLLDRTAGLSGDMQSLRDGLFNATALLEASRSTAMARYVFAFTITVFSTQFFNKKEMADTIAVYRDSTIAVALVTYVVAIIMNPSPLESDATQGATNLKRRSFDGNEDESVRIRPSKRRADIPNECLSSLRLMDDDEIDPHLRSPKLRPRSSIAPLFDRYPAHTNREKAYGDSTHNRRHRGSPSPPPEHPLAANINTKLWEGSLEREAGGFADICPGKCRTDTREDGYIDLRTELYSKAKDQLEKAQAELTMEVDDALKSEHQRLASLANQSAQIHAPLSDEVVDYSAKGADGQHRTVSIPIKDAITSFEKRLESTVESLDSLWASWEEAQADIETLRDELLPGSASDGSKAPSSNWAKLVTSIEGSADSTSNELEEELSKLARETVKEFEKHEKRFIDAIQNEGRGVVLESMLR